MHGALGPRGGAGVREQPTCRSADAWCRLGGQVVDLKRVHLKLNRETTVLVINYFGVQTWS